VTADDHAFVHALERRFGAAIPRRTVNVTKSTAGATSQSGTDRPMRPSSRLSSAQDDRNRPAKARAPQDAGNRAPAKDDASPEHSRRRTRRPSFSRTS
jgi:hypothetical protein